MGIVLSILKDSHAVDIIGCMIFITLSIEEKQYAQKEQYTEKEYTEKKYIQRDAIGMSSDAVW